jgi:hypothetical protein
MERQARVSHAIHHFGKVRLTVTRKIVGDASTATVVYVLAMDTGMFGAQRRFQALMVHAQTTGDPPAMTGGRSMALSLDRSAWGFRNCNGCCGHGPVLQALQGNRFLFMLGKR